MPDKIKGYIPFPNLSVKPKPDGRIGNCELRRLKWNSTDYLSERDTGYTMKIILQASLNLSDSPAGYLKKLNMNASSLWQCLPRCMRMDARSRYAYSPAI